MMKRVFMACLPERFALFVRREPWAAPDWCGFSFLFGSASGGEFCYVNPQIRFPFSAAGSTHVYPQSNRR
ncbi:hypothetical protein NB065_005130, partial [Serratia marcescens]